MKLPFSAFCALLLLVSTLVMTAAPAFAYRDEIGDRPNVLTRYRPIYVIAGHPDTKIQISFKMQPIENTPLYVGYTQQMLWELRKPSDPMRDINYAPELFYRWRMGGNSPTEWLDFGLIEHESNGQAGWNTRSWDRSYLRYFRQFSLGPVLIDASAQAWAPYGYDEMSSQLPQYCGIYEGVVTFSHFVGGFMSDTDLTVRFWGGGPHYINPGLGGQEATLRLRFGGQKFLPSLVAQLFNGYGENLLDADRRHFSWRVGLGF